MKKLITAALIFISVLASCCCGIYAAGLTSEAGVALPVERFEITGGIDVLKTSETTFDATRLISGTAQKGASVVINIYKPTFNEKLEKELILLETYALTVGSTGIFSQVIDLSVGENYITVDASKETAHSAFSTTIKRKESTIKSALEQCIALPGVGSSKSFTFSGAIK